MPRAELKDLEDLNRSIGRELVVSDWLAAAGVHIKKMPQPMPWGWRHAYLDDPDGHEISLYWAGAKRLRKSKM